MIEAAEGVSVAGIGHVVTLLARRMLAAKLRMRAMMPGFLRTRLASSATVPSRV